jgi:hypothetical protein
MHLRYLPLVLHAASSIAGLVARSGHDDTANHLANPRDIDNEDNNEDYVHPFESPEDEAAFHAERAAIEKMWAAEATFATTATVDENMNDSDFTAAGAINGGFSFQELDRYNRPWFCTNPATCKVPVYNQLGRRDTCNDNPCDTDAIIMRGAFKLTSSVCDKDFTACKAKGNRWKLKIRKTGDKHSCKSIKSLRGEGVPKNSFYGTLHDRGKNMKRVGHCYVDRGKAKGGDCGGGDYILAQKEVYCVWN